MDTIASPPVPALRSTIAASARMIERPLMRCLEVFAAALVAADVAILLIGVIARYVFRSPLIWTEELAQAVFLWLGMIGATVALNRGEHMRMTALIVRRHQDRGSAWKRSRQRQACCFWRWSFNRLSNTSRRLRGSRCLVSVYPRRG